MASCKPKHVVAMFFQLNIFYTINVVSFCKIINISINHRKHNEMSHVEIKQKIREIIGPLFVKQ
jgi:hypothetical protein